MCGIMKPQELRVCIFAVLGAVREYNWFKRKDRNGCPVTLSLGETVAAYDTEETDKSPLHAISKSRRFIDNNHGMIPRANDSASSPVVTMLPGL
ncbi:hypothetical protein CBS76997_4287 [Aspergillus niger]|nr:hypothetical protein CBS13152_8267 [Aspergillus niger]KAI2958412.1 hypothetical protein CBS147323_8700 [Aspergillus niger]KAI3018197.1 hypothetical protein CBS147347_9819 [Aspergillus niger]KAI3045803.1 hypothetical protein CBS76997_4287 [Aspergillus niger]KAI3064119.1 hypothetical protein CBS147353_8824 [Aspergillus niger]